jgi:predicted nicotinamide N-methyase
MILDRAAFILENTRLQPPPHTPELVLHMADDVMPIWRLTEEALEELGLPPPFWAFAWAGGQALARYILDRPQEVAGKQVVDFASGSGLVAIAAMKAGAANVLAIDIDEFAGAAIALNAAANRVEVACHIGDVLEAPPPPADVILAGDICYERPVAEKVIAWLATARAAGARVLIGDPERTYFPKADLVRLAEYRVPTVSALEDQEIKRTSVWTFPED